MLGIILVLLGGDRLMVLAQRRAKTKPVVPSGKAVQKPQGTEAELQDYARKYIDLYFTKCGGDSFYSYAYKRFGPRGFMLLETKDLLIKVWPKEVSKAESLNGLEGQGTIHISPAAYRDYDFSLNMWNEWKEGTHDIYWHMVKWNGAWSKKDVKVIPGVQASNRDDLTNTKVKVKCDNITAPLPMTDLREEP